MSQEPQLPWARALLYWWEFCTRVRQAEAFTGSCGHDNTGGAAGLAQVLGKQHSVQLCLFTSMQSRRAAMAAGMCALCLPRWLNSPSILVHMRQDYVCIYAYIFFLGFISIYIYVYMYVWLGKAKPTSSL